MPLEAFEAGFLSLLPPIIAIVLALITREVVFSLITGILSGTLIYSIASGMGPKAVFILALEFMSSRVGANSHMIIFLLILGALIAVITRAGGANSYSSWANKKLKGPKSAGLAVSFLGIIIFIDDYFSCLSVGRMMRPISDRHKISREKLAYIIDTTAAPVCILAPVSSWAAAVIGMIDETATITGMEAFIGSIPMNLYGILSIVMVFWLCIRPKDDFGPMAAAQARAEGGEIKAPNSDEAPDEISAMEVSSKGRLLDLLVPIVVLVTASIIAMLYYDDASLALALGGFLSLFIAFFMYVPRRLMNMKHFFSSAIAGVKSVTPAIIILCLAWTIASVCSQLLSTGDYVAGLVIQSRLPVMLFPPMIFVTACLLSFATGTSWGTYGILIPIVVSFCQMGSPWLFLCSLSSVLAGGVFGDHCSPISDSTILSSAGAECPHLDHVKTQIPYAITVAAVCVIGYVIAGFTSGMGYLKSIVITLPASLILLIIALILIPKTKRSRN